VADRWKRILAAISPERMREDVWDSIERARAAVQIGEPRASSADEVVEVLLHAVSVYYRHVFYLPEVHRDLALADIYRLLLGHSGTIQDLLRRGMSGYDGGRRRTSMLR